MKAKYWIALLPAGSPSANKGVVVSLAVAVNSAAKKKPMSR
jgi:hypothetical protein